MNIYKLVEKHLRPHLNDIKPLVEKVDARDLLTYKRFDLAFKLVYLEMLDKNVSFTKGAYREHIRAFSLGSFKEPGQEEKNSIEKYYKSFLDTFFDIKSNGFNASRSLVPVSYNGTIVNGAHRVASAIFLNQEVQCVRLKLNDPVYDYKFFYSRNVDKELLDLAATKFVEYASNVFIAIVWPTAVGCDTELESIIQNIFYRKNVKLSLNGAHNLISQVYYGEPWLGTTTNNFSGANGKLVECFKTSNPVRIIGFQAVSLDAVREIKQRVRKLFDAGKSSIHITDTKEEAIRIARLMFNDNCIHFLNYAQPNKYRSSHIKINEFKTFLERNKISKTAVVLDGGIVLSLYGLREASDVDYLACDTALMHISAEEFDCHDEELRYHNEEKGEMIYNPKFYFYFNDIKFISFNQIYRMKRCRAGQKDTIDYQLMESIIDNNEIKKVILKIKQRIYYGRIKLSHKFCVLRSKVFSVLKYSGMYNTAKQVYRYFKK